MHILPLRIRCRLSCLASQGAGMRAMAGDEMRIMGGPYLIPSLGILRPVDA